VTIPLYIETAKNFLQLSLLSKIIGRASAEAGKQGLAGL
jgi:hypothetical protein